MMPDAAPYDIAAGSAVAERRCVLTGEVLPRVSLLRFALLTTPDGQKILAPDLAEKLGGRGAWISSQPSVLRKAIQTGAFRRALKENIENPDADLIAPLLLKRARESLGLARKSGALIAGFELVSAALQGVGTKTKPIAFRLEAADGSEDGRRKLTALNPGLPVLSVFTAAEQGEALGREPVVHLAIQKAGVAANLLKDALRLWQWRQDKTLDEMLGDGATQRLESYFAKDKP